MTLLKENAAAEMLGCSISKLQKDRRIGSAIPFIKVGRCVFYRKDDLNAYITNRTFTSTSQYGGK